jgi:DNA-binding LacI/PurR family transcriptional regulator
MDENHTVTLRDIATAAGVSVSTASRVLNGDDRVGADRRASVLQAADRLGYVVNRAARSLRTRRSGTIAVVLAEESTIVFGSTYFGQLLGGIAEILNSFDLQIAVFLPQNDRDEQRLRAYLATGPVDGVLLTYNETRDQLQDHLLDKGIPLVANARSLSAKSASYVDVDNEQGAYMAVRHLLDKGCKVVATVAAQQGIAPGVDRLSGYRRALAQAGLEHGDDLIRFGDFTTDSGRQLTADLLAGRPDIDGLFVAGQLMSYGALRALREAGRRVPADVAVVGFDDLPGAESTDPPLTSIHQPVEQIGRELARLLIAEISDGTASRKRVILDTELVERDSSQLGRQP